MAYEKLQDMAGNLPPVPASIEEYAYVADVSAEAARRLVLQARYDTLEPLTSSDASALNDLLRQEPLELFAFGWDGALFDDATGFRGELVSHHPLPPTVSFDGRL